jgi:hypothetical protein
MNELEKEKRLIDRDKKMTQLKKKQFIREIRGGLGDHIKKNGNKIKKLKKSPFRRFIDKIMEMF